jgi:hypothetical protein
MPAAMTLVNPGEHAGRVADGRDVAAADPAACGRAPGVAEIGHLRPPLLGWEA